MGAEGGCEMTPAYHICDEMKNIDFEDVNIIMNEDIHPPILYIRLRTGSVELIITHCPWCGGDLG